MRRSAGTCRAPVTTPASSARTAVKASGAKRRGLAIRGNRPRLYEGAGTLGRVTGIDWLIVGIIVLLALFGWAQGFVAGALALLGFAIGAWVGTRVGPLLLDDGRRSPWSPAFGLVGALIAGMVFAIGFEGIGSRLRGLMRAAPGLTAADGILGAALTAIVGLGIAWVLGALALANGGQARREVQRSAILQKLNAVLPPSEGLLSALARLESVPAHRRA